MIINNGDSRGAALCYNIPPLRGFCNVIATAMMDFRLRGNDKTMMDFRLRGNDKSMLWIPARGRE